MSPARAWRRARPLAALTLVALLVVPALGAAHTPSRPKELAAAATGAGVLVSWAKSSDGHVTGYVVYRQGAGGTFSAIADVTGTSYTDAGATAGTYRVTAHDSSGDEGNPSDPATSGAGAGAPAGTTAGPAATADVTVEDNTFTAA